MEKDANLDKLIPKQITETSRAHYSQKIWRQKQITIFYLTGRPIFDIPDDIPIDIPIDIPVDINMMYCKK